VETLTAPDTVSTEECSALSRKMPARGRRASWCTSAAAAGEAKRVVAAIAPAKDVMGCTPAISAPCGGDAGARAARPQAS